MIHFQVFKI